MAAQHDMHCTHAASPLRAQTLAPRPTACAAHRHAGGGDVGAAGAGAAKRQRLQRSRGPGAAQRRVCVDEPRAAVRHHAGDEGPHRAGGRFCFSWREGVAVCGKGKEWSGRRSGAAAPAQCLAPGAPEPPERGMRAEPPCLLLIQAAGKLRARRTLARCTPTRRPVAISGPCGRDPVLCGAAGADQGAVPGTDTAGWVAAAQMGTPVSRLFFPIWRFITVITAKPCCNERKCC